jgi:hypothetical protein
MRHLGSHTLAAVIAALMAATAAPRVGAAPDPAAVYPAWIAPHPLRASPDAVPATLSVPPGWSAGDAAVLVLHQGEQPAWRAALTEALLEEDAAVLELRLAPEDHHAALLAGGLLYLQQHFGAGLLVAIGFGASGEIALAAARQARHGVPRMAILTAGVAIGGPATRFAAGREAPPDQAWSLRAALFCAMLERLEAGADAACRRALAASPSARVAGLP